MARKTGAPLLAGAYFDFLFGHDEGYACIRTFKGGRFGHPDGPVQKHWYAWPQKRNEMVAFVLANSTLDLYVVPSLFHDTTSAKASNISHQTCIYVDADGATPELFKVPPSIIMETSPGRHHLFWKTDTDDPSALCMVGRTISHQHAHQGCDKGGWDAGQLLRIPGSTNNKPRGSGPYYIMATTTGQMYDIEELKEAYPPELIEVPSGHYEKMPPSNTWPPLEEAEQFFTINFDLQELYTLKEGDRSKRMYRLLCEFSRRGLDKVSSMVLAWNAGCNKYAQDGRPPQDLWRELCKAFAEPMNQMATTELAIENHMKVRAAEEVKADGREVNRRYQFLYPDERAAMPNDMLVDRYVAWAGTVTDAAPAYQRAGIMTVLSAVLGEFGLPPTKFYMGRLNLWFMVLGGTTRSRKSTARHMWLKLLRDLQSEQYIYDLGSDITQEALAEELGEKPGWSSVFHRDEVHGLLGEQMSKGYLAGLQETMTELYDGHVRVRKRVGQAGAKKKLGKATTTNFIINFSGVTDHVTNALTAEDFASGYLARFLYVYAEAPKRTRDGERMEQFTPNTTKREDMVLLEIKEEIRAVRTFWEKRAKRGVGVRIPFEPAAWERLNDFAWDLGTAAAESDMAKMLEPVADRMAKSILKSACLLAMAEQSTTVKMRHMVKAIELGEEWFNNMMIIATKIRESHWQTQQDEVIAVLDAANGRMTWHAMYRKFRGKFRPKQFEEIITALSESGEVVAKIEARSRIIYRVDMNNGRAEPAPLPPPDRPSGRYPASLEPESHEHQPDEGNQDHGGGSFLSLDDIPA